MGYALVIGYCCVCDKPLAFNPMKVPSLRIDGVREPVCGDCVAEANQDRQEQGLDLIQIHPEAYGPCPEEELSSGGW